MGIGSNSNSNNADYVSLSTNGNEVVVDTPAPATLKQALIAEVFGTCLFVQIGCGGLCAGLYMGAFTCIWQNAMIWLLGATLAIYAVGNISGAHLNPAVTLSFALVRPADFEMKKLPLYWAAQLLGAMIAAILNYFIFMAAIHNFVASSDFFGRQDQQQQHEEHHSTSSSKQFLLQSASAFGNYWSLNGGVAGPFHATFIEAFGTAFLTFVIFAITHPKNDIPGAAVSPIVGTAIGLMVALLGTLTGGSINPARDLGPRIITCVMGWGMSAFTNYGAYIVGPLLGGPVGAFLADFVLNMD